MALHATETRYIHFPRYNPRYKDFYIALTNANDVFPAVVRLEKDGVCEGSGNWYRNTVVVPGIIL